MATVSSMLPESTTMISSAQAALSIASAMCAASLSVMMVTVTRGTVVMLSHGRALRGSAALRGASTALHGASTALHGPAALQRHLLHGLQVNHRAMEIKALLQLHVARK